MSDTATVPAPAPDAAPAPASPPADRASLEARDQELNTLAETDLPRYRYSDGGRLANEHVQVRRALAAAKEATPPAEQAEGTDTDADAEATELVAAETEAPEDEVNEEADEADDEAGLAEYESEIEPWQPPEGEEIAEYAKPALAALDKLVGDAEQRDGVIAIYEQLRDAQQAEVKRRNAEAYKAVQQSLTKDEIAGIKSAAKAMPAELRQMLNTAVLPDGTKLANQTAVLRMIAAAYGQKGANPPPHQDNQAMLREELAAIHALRDRDIDEYHRPWRATGKSASDRAYEIARELAHEGPTRPTQADLDSEERALLRLRNTDMQKFMFGDWNNTGRPAAERLTRIQQGRA